MNEKVKKAKLIYRVLLISAFIAFLGLFFYQLLFFPHTLIEQINLFLIVLLSIIWLIANFYKDKFARYEKQEEIIDFWLFYIVTISKMFDSKEVFKYFALLPKLKKQSDNQVEKARVRLNFYIVSCYLLFVLLIITTLVI